VVSPPCWDWENGERSQKEKKKGSLHGKALERSMKKKKNAY